MKLMNTKYKLGKRENHVGNPLPLKRQCIKRRKWQLLCNCVLHCKTIPQIMKLLPTESLCEDVEILMDMMKSLGNMSSLVPFDPMDPSTPGNIPFWWKWN
jgi:hypothetical protein